MKISKIPTEYLLIQAFDKSEMCDFAIIHTTEEWKAVAKKRVEISQQFENDNSLLWLNYKHPAISFFNYSKAGFYEIQEWINEKRLVFIETNSEEIQKLERVNLSFSNFHMQVFSDGNAIINAFETHLGDEFWTYPFSINELLK